MERLETLANSPQPASVPQTRICPFLSTGEKLIECLRERCAIWVIQECAVVRLTKSKQTF